MQRLRHAHAGACASRTASAACPARARTCSAVRYACRLISTLNMAQLAAAARAWRDPAERGTEYEQRQWAGLPRATPPGGLRPARRFQLTVTTFPTAQGDWSTRLVHSTLHSDSRYTIRRMWSWTVEAAHGTPNPTPTIGDCVTMRSTPDTARMRRGLQTNESPACSDTRPTPLRCGAESRCRADGPRRATQSNSQLWSEY